VFAQPPGQQPLNTGLPSIRAKASSRSRSAGATRRIGPITTAARSTASPAGTSRRAARPTLSGPAPGQNRWLHSPHRRTPGRKGRSISSKEAGVIWSRRLPPGFKIQRLRTAANALGPGAASLVKSSWRRHRDRGGRSPGVTRERFAQGPCGKDGGAGIPGPAAAHRQPRPSTVADSQEIPCGRARLRDNRAVAGGQASAYSAFGGVSWAWRPRRSWPIGHDHPVDRGVILRGNNFSEVAGSGSHQF